jgi:hypothetical protein
VERVVIPESDHAEKLSDGSVLDTCHQEDGTILIWELQP